MPKNLAQLKADAKIEGWSEWIMSEADERAVLDGCWFDVKAGKHWCDFFEKYFVFTKGDLLAGKPYRLMPYQRNDILMPLFGWKKSRERPYLRRYSKGDVFTGKKQGKSTTAALICNAMLMKSGQRTEVYGVAHSKEQAGVIYREAAAFARKSPELRTRLKPLDAHKRIVFEQKGSFYQALAGENGARSAEGIIPTLVLFDEIHVQRDRLLYDALAYACIAQENSLFLSISTVGVEDKTTIWWEQYQYAKGILDGTLHDNDRFAYIAQADEGCKNDPTMRADPKQWAKAMPALGITVTEEKVAAAVREAENSPAKLNGLLRYVFNIPTAQVDRVIPMDKWELCRGALPDLTNRECYAGLDVASVSDLTCLALFFPPKGEETRGWLKSFFWCPKATILERERKGMAFYRQWINDGRLLTTPGQRIEHSIILHKINECARTYRIKELLFDKWNADAIVNPLQFTDIQCISVEQTFVGMSAFCSRFIDAVIEEQFWHDGNEVMTWCCANTAADIRQDSIRFAKDKSADKIDGAVAAAMAIGRGLTVPKVENMAELFFV